jgi:phosphate transport system substrate-binding protein
MEEEKRTWKDVLSDLVLKIILTFLGVIVLGIPVAIGFLLLSDTRYLLPIRYGIPLTLPILVLWKIWLPKRKAFFRYWLIGAGILILALIINTVYIEHDRQITINTTPNIRLHEYMPFDPESKIATLDQPASLKLRADLPVVDGAAAVFPLYSAFVNATYPNWVKLYDGTLEYNNTVGGYELLAKRETDIFFGAYPSEEQIAFAEKLNTEFVYTPIGKEAFVFFIHKDNPIDNLTTEQIKAIYSGEITNWKQLGGKNEPISAYQRNEGSGSQSMLIRFMDGTPIMEPDTEKINDLMSGIIEQVADYRNKNGSIGFSFRYYMEGIIKNPDVKLLSVDGVAPTVENIQSGAYPITASLYAVTWKGNNNRNVEKLLKWILSPEGQELVEKTGYVPIG